MEVFYYFEKPELLTKHIYDNWLVEGGKLIMGIDYYHENKPSHTWQKDCGNKHHEDVSKRKLDNIF